MGGLESTTGDSDSVGGLESMMGGSVNGNVTKGKIGGKGPDRAGKIDTGSALDPSDPLSCRFRIILDTGSMR